MRQPHIEWNTAEKAGGEGLDAYLTDNPDRDIADRVLVDEESIESMVQRIRDGEPDLRDLLIERCLPFIRNRVRRAINTRHVDDTDELSVAILAFNDCIDRYKAYEPGSFLRFASTVIGRRIIDHQRHMQRQGRALPFSSVTSGDGTPFEESRFAASHVDFDREIETEEEIVLLENRLSSFGLHMEDMYKETPKHTDSRILCVAAARRIVSDTVLSTTLYASRRLPVAQLALQTGLHRKTIERNRKFIILLVLLLDSELDLIKSYIDTFYGQGTRGGNHA